MIKRRRRSIGEYFKVHHGGFCGWDTMEQTQSRLDQEVYYIFNGLFVLGPRVNELNTLKRKNVALDEPGDFIWIRSMEVEKQRAIKRDEMGKPIPKIDSDGKRIFTSQGIPVFELESKKGYRTFPIRRDNPLVSIFEDYVRGFKNPDDILYPYSASQMYYRLALIDNKIPEGVSKSKWGRAEYLGPWWPHRLRAERACQLIRDYDFNTFRLQTWFGWATLQMPEFYGTLLPKDLTLTMKRLEEWI